MKMLYHKRWLIRRDMFCIVNSLERFTSKRWSHEDYITHLKESKKIGMVVHPYGDDDGLVMAFVYKLHKDKLVIGHLVLNPEFDGVVKYFTEVMDDKLSKQGRKTYKIYVPEKDLWTQQAFAEHGIKCIKQKDDILVFARNVGVSKPTQRD
jgi:hypothetical protein